MDKDKHNGAEAVTESCATVKCHICGYEDSYEYCSRCGASLTMNQYYSKSIFRTFVKNANTVLIDFSNPLFAFLKTFWLVVVRPKRFFHALFYRDAPIADISFPLEKPWKRISPEVYQYTLDPIKYFLSLALLSIFMPSIGITKLTLADELFGRIEEDTISGTIVAELARHMSVALLFALTMIIIGGFAVVFRLPLQKKKRLDRKASLDLTRQVYLYWIYSFITIFISIFITAIVLSVALSKNSLDYVWMFLVGVIMGIFTFALIIKTFLITPFIVFDHHSEYSVILSQFLSITFLVVIIFSLIKFNGPVLILTILVPLLSKAVISYFPQLFATVLAVWIVVYGLRRFQTRRNINPVRHQEAGYRDNQIPD